MIRAVLESGNGYIVLPGVDQDMEDELWKRLPSENPEHPQRSLSRLLDTLGVDRSVVRQLDGPASERARTTGLTRRSRLMAEAMRPAQSTDAWRGLPERFTEADARVAFAGVTRLSVPTAQDEAEVIALIMREVAETPGRTAALVSPDRLLARRVAARLESWDIQVDDSAGRPFAKTVPGAFLDLVVQAAADWFAPAALMALLKHPLTRLGWQVRDIRLAARALEVAVFRAPYIGTGIAGVRAGLDRQNAAIEAGPPAGSRRPRASR